MKLIKRTPGPLLVFLGAFCLSFGGVIVKSFERCKSMANSFLEASLFCYHCSFIFNSHLQKKIFLSHFITPAFQVL